MKQKPSSRRGRSSTKSVLRLPDVEHAKSAVLNSLNGMTVKAVCHIVKESAGSIGVAKLAPRDLRRTCARLCHASGGELEQIQFRLGHVFGANDRTLPWLQAADSIGRQ